MPPPPPPLTQAPPKDTARHRRETIPSPSLTPARASTLTRGARHRVPAPALGALAKPGQKQQPPTRQPATPPVRLPCARPATLTPSVRVVRWWDATCDTTCFFSHARAHGLFILLVFTWCCPKRNGRVSCILWLPTEIQEGRIGPPSASSRCS